MNRGKLIAALTAAVAVAGSAGGSAAQPPASGLLAYAGNGKIYLINADGTGRRPIISGVRNARDFSWSPDGRRIAYTDSFFGIAVASVNGTAVRLLTKGLDVSNSASDPTWSPDGKRIAFTAWPEGTGGPSAYVIGVDGKNLRELPTPDAPEFLDWSPDGRWLLFGYWSGTGRERLMAMHPDGAGLHQIAIVVTGVGHCICGDWSPDGSKIAYQGSLDPKDDHPEIFVMNADGSGRIRLTHSPARDENPDWSPDGTRIAFYSERNGDGEIYVMNADGTGLRRVTHDPWYSALPEWQPRP